MAAKPSKPANLKAHGQAVKAMAKDGAVAGVKLGRAALKKLPRKG